MSQISETYNIDCLEYMKGISDNFFDLAVVDPPYGIGIEANAFKNGLNCRANGFKKHLKKKWDDSTPSDEYFGELKRVSKNQIIWGGNYFNLPATRCFLIWDKVQRIDQADCEFAWTSFVTSARVFQYARGNESGFAPKLTNAQKVFANIHPTQKPIALYKWILQNYAKPGQRIFDSHLGSQSSRIAAWDMGFDFWGCELDEDYFKQGNERFEDHKAKHQTLFDKKEMFFPEQLTLL